MQIFVVVILRVDFAILQDHGDRIRQAVVGGFVRLRAPFVGHVGHDLDGVVRYPQGDLLDFADVAEK